MGNLLRVPNGRAIVLTPRSGSHSLATSALRSFWPDIVVPPGTRHPAGAFPVQENYDDTQENVAIIVRNPVERFRSMVAHWPHCTLEEQLENPLYGPLPQGNFVHYFRFEDQLQDAADWLGITVSLPHEDATTEDSKPKLTAVQEAQVREIYAADMVLWQSLHSSSSPRCR